MIDDLTGEASETVRTRRFSVDGAEYEIDLDETNSDELDDQLVVYIEAARRVGKTARAGRPSRQSAGASAGKYSRETTKQIRAWARSNGWPNLKDRGRVPNDAVTAWERAHQEQAAA